MNNIFFYWSRRNSKNFERTKNFEGAFCRYTQEKSLLFFFLSHFTKRCCFIFFLYHWTHFLLLNAFTLRLRFSGLQQIQLIISFPLPSSPFLLSQAQIENQLLLLFLHWTSPDRPVSLPPLVYPSTITIELNFSYLSVNSTLKTNDSHLSSLRFCIPTDGHYRSQKKASTSRVKGPNSLNTLDE